MVGLTGGIGSGKTTVAEAFAALGAEVVDTDRLAHQLSAAGQPGFTAVVAAFGRGVLQSDGELDRAMLRQLVFADAAARARLETALHPLIEAEVARQVEAWRGPYGIVVVPLLLERDGLRSRVDRVLVVDSVEADQVRRVGQRNGLLPTAVRAIMATQLSRTQRLAAADDIISNSGTPDAIVSQVQALDRRYRELAAAARHLHASGLCLGLSRWCTMSRRRWQAIDVIHYEHPLNERIRTLMRLEDLYRRTLFFAGETTAADHHVALVALFEIIDVAARADLKADLLQELIRQRQLLAPLRHNPAIEPGALDALLSEIDNAASNLSVQAGKVGQHVRDNEWLMAIKQRTGIPGGACEFDLPAYHHWLHLEPAARQRDLKEWLAPLLPIDAGLSIILRLLRDNGKTSSHTAHNGVFQLMLTTAKIAQLLRLSVAKNLPCVPEISANKYALNIRFVGVAGMDRGSVYEGDFDFDLMFCNL